MKINPQYSSVFSRCWCPTLSLSSDASCLSCQCLPCWPSPESCSEPLYATSMLYPVSYEVTVRAQSSELWWPLSTFALVSKINHTGWKHRLQASINNCLQVFPPLKLMFDSLELIDRVDSVSKYPPLPRKYTKLAWGPNYSWGESP